MRYLKIESLEPKNVRWVDSDVLMLHSCFQILKDCVEKEHVDTHANYETHKEFVDEVRFLYDWWSKRSKKFSSDKQDIEDDQMLLRLMEIRRILWT
jgi:hypothetical protein